MTNAAFALALLLLTFGVPNVSQARVFNYKDSGAAAFVRGTGGLISMGQSAFLGGSGANASVDGTSRMDYGGELGVIWAVTPIFHLRLGAELLQAKTVSEAPGTNSSGTRLFNLTSSVSAFNPNLAVEWVWHATGGMRFFWIFGVGYAEVTADNKYTMTSAGQSAFGVGDYQESISGTTLSYLASLGFETLFADNATFALDVGYRGLSVNKLKYKSDANTILSSSGVHKGEAVLNRDGSARTIDLSGLTVGASFRFYLNFF